MGTSMYLYADRFRIKAEDKEKALEKIKELMKDPNASRGGYNYEEGRVFSWLHNSNPEKWSSLEEALTEWRFKPETNDNGDIVGLEFTGQKVGDEKQMFKRIAPYVQQGSRLEFSYEGYPDTDVFKFNGEIMEVNP
jgi:hypothetical protein